MNLADKLDMQGIRIAPMGARIVAFFIDEMVLTLLVLAIFYERLNGIDYGESKMDATALVATLSSLQWSLLLLRFIYQSFFTWYFGASVGKLIMGLRVIDVDMLDKPSLGASCLRSVVYIISYSCFCLGFLWAFASPLRRAWEDIVARTVVIYAR